MTSRFSPAQPAPAQSHAPGRTAGNILPLKRARQSVRTPPTLPTPATAPEPPRLEWIARGNVGPRQSSLLARQWAPEAVHVSCVNNPRFWLVVDTDTRTAHGVVVGSRLNGSATFEVAPTEHGFSVKHPLCPWFWLEIAKVA